MPIYDTLAQAMRDEPILRRYLDPASAPPDTPGLDRLRQKFKKSKKLPNQNRNFCGGSGSIHSLSPVFEERNPMECIEMQDLQKEGSVKEDGEKKTEKGGEGKEEMEGGEGKPMSRNDSVLSIHQTRSEDGKVKAEGEAKGRRSYMLDCKKFHYAITISD